MEDNVQVPTTARVDALEARVARIEAHLQGRPEPPQPPDPPEPGVFRALGCFDNEALDNKLVRLPALRKSRQPREDVEALGDIRGGDWKQGEHLIWSDKNSVVPKGYSQWSSNMHKGPLVRRGGSYTWKNIGVASGLDARQLKWGTREYNAPDRAFISCDFTEITQEHGLYVSNSGDTSLQGCTFLRVGSQGGSVGVPPVAVPAVRRGQHALRGEPVPLRRGLPLRGLWAGRHSP